MLKICDQTIQYKMSEFSIAEENKKCPTPEQMPVNAPIIGHPLDGGTGTQTTNWYGNL